MKSKKTNVLYSITQTKLALICTASAIVIAVAGAGIGYAIYYSLNNNNKLEGIKSFKTFNSLDKFLEKHIKNPSQGIDFTTRAYDLDDGNPNDGTNSKMLDWIARHIDSKIAVMMMANSYSLVYKYALESGLSVQVDTLSINFDDLNVTSFIHFSQDGSSMSRQILIQSHIEKMDATTFWFSETSVSSGRTLITIPITEYKLRTFGQLSLNIDSSMVLNGRGGLLVPTESLSVLPSLPILSLPNNCWTKVTFPKAR